MTTKESPAAIAHALRRYRPLRPVIDAVGPPPASRPIPVAARYNHLVRAIVHQQLAGKAAEAIFSRLVSGVGGEITPASISQTDDATLASFGLSGSKRAAIIDLTRHVEERRVQLTRHGRLSNDDVIAELVQVRGIGEWTAHMYLMNALARPDVWPTGDYGVRNGWSLLHDISPLITPGALATAADDLAPRRSAVAWYCWQAVDVARATGR